MRETFKVEVERRVRTENRPLGNCGPCCLDGECNGKSFPRKQRRLWRALASVHMGPVTDLNYDESPIFRWLRRRYTPPLQCQYRNLSGTDEKTQDRSAETSRLTSQVRRNNHYTTTTTRQVRSSETNTSRDKASQHKWQAKAMWPPPLLPRRLK